MTTSHLLFSDQDLLTPKLAAIYLGGTSTPLALTTLSNWRAKGTGPTYIRVGDSIRYPVSGLREFMQCMTVNPIRVEVLECAK